MTGPAYARRLVDQARAAGVEIRTRTTITRLLPGPTMEVTTEDGPTTLTARRVLLATGVRETSRAQRLIGGARPGGVLNTGALQGLVYLKGARPFRRPVILGTELVSFSAILTCRHAGIRPAAMLCPGPHTVAPWPTGLFPGLVGVPLLRNTNLVAIEGGERVTAVITECPNGRRRLPCDGVIVTGGFRPEDALLRTGPIVRDAATGGPVVDQFGRCTEPGYFAAGNLLRAVETAGWCWAEGRAVGRAIARDLKTGLPSAAPLRLTAHGDALAFALPQRLTPVARDGALQFRLKRPARGALLLETEGRTLWSHGVDSRPERRLTLPLGLIPPEMAGAATLTFRETL